MPYPNDYPTEFLAFYDQVGPWVYHYCVCRARDLKSRGYVVIGIRLLWEGARYDSARPKPPEGCVDFGLNNNHAAHLARLIEEREPDLEGFFRKRRLRDENGQLRFVFDTQLELRFPELEQAASV